ncbi:MAG: hypothetical protein QF560_05135 [SAR324 cluster bacterium]|jgi:hypothetical protein|nr:hypothetical protein [Deltaproteobacteria bacterium]MDP6091486.1 hypothetical protein [SAR324 cluster bacterium]MBP44369.1 hypothetical protein [Deltaproteobacteria bacterium]MDP6245564.1 hypothetical protein [SAR324 cluster bacterium]MDP6463635.1 hypothetical protein [SAR324 cluster bacterium]|tara:strand:- start:818 stop:1021 length:204 start_codon:yes stop_codon:yes gene_type:complete
MKNSSKKTLQYWFRREIWENIASVLIILGVFMLLQPYSIFLYTYSFIIILAGTLGFVIFSHFPNGKD